MIQIGNMQKKYDPKDDIFIKITASLKFTSNDKYTNW